jgi:hypothetical protein
MYVCRYVWCLLFLRHSAAKSVPGRFVIILLSLLFTFFCVSGMQKRVRDKNTRVEESVKRQTGVMDVRESVCVQGICKREVGSFNE